MRNLHFGLLMVCLFAITDLSAQTPPDLDVASTVSDQSNAVQSVAEQSTAEQNMVQSAVQTTQLTQTSKNTAALTTASKPVQHSQHPSKPRQQSVGQAGLVDPIKIGYQLYLNIPGEAAFEQPFQVDQEGQINLPELGKVKLAGMNRLDAEVMLQQSLAEIYLDIASFYLEIRKRELLVTVLGYVNEPAQVTLPEAGNIQMAVNQAGGLRAGAQLDRMHIRRGDAMLQFDYKAYLDSGDMSLLPILKSGDIVFVPASPLIGNVQVDFDAQTLASSGDASESNLAITLFGELHNPGTFSFKPEMTLVDALMRADGVTRFGDVTKIRVIRDGEPTLFDLKYYLDTGDKSLMPQIKPGTTIFVPIMVDDVDVTARTVYIIGEVKKPGAYEATDDVSFLDILANAGGPTRFAETRQIRLLKESGLTIDFDLQAFTESQSRQAVPDVKPGDVIFVPEKTDLNEKSWLKVPPERAIKIIGAVYRPGRFEWSDEMSLLDLLAHAGGPTKGANITDIRIMKQSEQSQPLFFNLEEYIKQGSDASLLPVLVAGDTVLVEELPHDPKDNKAQWVRQSSDKSIYVFGQVGAPGRYAFELHLNFLDILAAADGPTGQADLKNIRINHRNHSYAKVTHLDLALYFETGDETLLPRVQPGDSIFIPEKDKTWLREPKERHVRLMGAVNNPGRYTFDDSMNLLDLLAEAGGPNNAAMIDKIIVVNNACCKEASSVFDLDQYLKKPNAENMPVLRAGDTVYVPDAEDSIWKSVLGDVWDVVGVLALVGVL